MYAILSTDGCMSVNEVKECEQNEFVPIAVERVDGKTYVPLFTDKKLAKRSKERNLPKDWPTGVVQMHTKHIEKIKEMGFIPYVCDFPKKTKFETEVIEIPVDLSYTIRYRR